MAFRASLLLFVFGAALSAHRLPVKVYTSANGVPRNSARCLVPDTNGMLWICTSEGLVRFDGYQFRVFGPEQGLPSRSIFDLVPSRHGGYWLVTDAGVCRLPAGSKIGDRCQPLEIDGHTGDFEPDCLAETAAGATWVATADALYRVSDDSRRLEPTSFHLAPSQGHIEVLADAPDGSLLVAADFALYRWRPDSKSGWTQQEITFGDAPIPDIKQIVFVSENEVWAAASRRLYRLMDWKHAASPNVGAVTFPNKRWVTRMVRRSDGAIWAAGDGLSRLEFDAAGQFVEIENNKTREGLPDNVIDLLAQDRQGNIWGSTGGSGIFRIAQSGFTVYSETDGLGSARIGAIFQSLAGDICVIHSPATTTDAVTFAVKNGSRFDPVRYQRTSKKWASGWGWNQFGFQAHDGEWWFASGAGLFRFAAAARAQALDHASPIAIYNASSPLRVDQIFRVFEDSRGDIWVMGLNPSTLLRWERKSGRFHRFTATEGWPEDRVATVIREAPSGTIWVGTYGEIIRWRKGRFEILPALPSAQVPMVRDLYLDRRGRVWIATSRYGLFRCDNPEDARPVFRNYTTRDGLSSDSVRSIIEDNDGLIYAGTVRAIDQIDPDAAPGAHRIRHFTPADGVPDNEQNVAFRDRDGRLWFGSLNGLAEFDPSKAPSSPPPFVYITRLRVRGDEIPLPWEGARNFRTQLAPDKNQFEIQYAGVDLASVSSLRYQYRLAGVDRDWSQPVEDVSFNYASLPAGDFRFEVRAISASGQPGEAAAFDVTVQAALWKRPWFVTLAAAMLAMLVTAAYRYRVRQLLAVERLRTRLASDLHDDIGASLTQISILAELARESASPDVLDDVARIARGIVGEMSDIVWAIKPHHDRLDALAHRMRRFAADTLADAELEFDTSGLPDDISVPLEYRRPLFLVFKETANNIARHAAATHVRIRLSVQDQILQLTMEDDGIGFDPAAPRDGEGISSIQRRMRDIGGSAIWESNPGGGTRFTAILPLSPNRKLDKLGVIFTRSSH